MQYLCEKQLTAGEVTYYPGERIPDGVILPERSGKLIRSGYLSKLDPEGLGEESDTFYTQEQLDKIVAEAVDEAVNNTVAEMEQRQKELQETAGVLQSEGFLPEDTVMIPIPAKEDSDGEKGQKAAVPATLEEIRQVFGIMQMNATEGAEAIAGVESENVLILLHAADSRKTIKDAAKKQADYLFTVSGQ